jgi:hypothetical protein
MSARFPDLKTRTNRTSFVRFLPIEPCAANVRRATGESPLFRRKIAAHHEHRQCSYQWIHEDEGAAPGAGVRNVSPPRSQKTAACREPFDAAQRRRRTRGSRRFDKSHPRVPPEATWRFVALYQRCQEPTTQHCGGGLRRGVDGVQDRSYTVSVRSRISRRIPAAASRRCRRPAYSPTAFATT